MAKTPTTNTLYYGDNLDILREYIADESVDLVGAGLFRLLVAGFEIASGPF
jgi:hypothetical protein